MRFQKQLIPHDPDNGQEGDCWRAAYASLLGLPIKSVPHFAENYQSDEVCKEKADAFLESKGLKRIVMPVQGELAGILETMACHNPGIPYLLTGNSSLGCAHCVLCQDNDIIFDPSSRDTGIVGPCDDGLFWIEILGVFVGTY